MNEVKRIAIAFVDFGLESIGWLINDSKQKTPFRQMPCISRSAEAEPAIWPTESI